MRAYHVIRSSQ